MSAASRRTLLEWSAILLVIVVIAVAGSYFFFGDGAPAREPSGLPDGTGGFYQSPVSPPQQYTKTIGDWQYTLTSSYSYTLAGRIVGRHEYPATPPDGIIPLDLAVANGELVSNDILSFFTFDMGPHNLTYSYDIPRALGLTDEYIDEHISNSHLVFLNATLEEVVKEAPVGSCMILNGSLVDILGTTPGKKYTVKTSTVRNDEYPGGCEIILVESYAPVSCGSR